MAVINQPKFINAVSNTIIYVLVGELTLFQQYYQSYLRIY